MNPQMRQLMTRMPDATAIGNGPNTADVSERLPIRNLNEALDKVANRVHTTLKQRLMSITMIARQAQGLHAGEVIAKLVEDAYFMRVDNRVTQVPPLKTHEPRQHEATSRNPVECGCNQTRGEQPSNPNRSRDSVGGPS
jgi:hypothetical protein